MLPKLHLLNNRTSLILAWLSYSLFTLRSQEIKCMRNFCVTKWIIFYVLAVCVLAKCSGEAAYVYFPCAAKKEEFYPEMYVCMYYVWSSTVELTYNAQRISWDSSSGDAFSAV